MSVLMGKRQGLGAMCVSRSIQWNGSIKWNKQEETCPNELENGDWELVVLSFGFSSSWDPGSRPVW